MYAKMEFIKLPYLAIAMNTKIIIRTLLSGIILFLWQFVSWAASGLHSGSQNYTPKQDSIMAALSSMNLAEGGYIMPMPQPNASAEDFEKFSKETAGKPWAQVYYHPSKNSNMGVNMLRGVLIDFVLVFLLMFLLDKMPVLGLIQGKMYAVTVGIIAFFAEPYTHFIWYQTPNIWSFLIDAIIPYAIIGLLYAKFWQNK